MDFNGSTDRPEFWRGTEAADEAPERFQQRTPPSYHMNMCSSVTWKKSHAQ
jgi:hypothetical protein